MKFKQLPTEILPNEIARILSYVCFADKNACWHWTGTTDSKYGKCFLGDSEYKAHRVIYWIFTGRRPDVNKDVCHACDNPICVNPYHLFEGTRSENLQDMIAKGRRCFAKPRGDASGFAKLSDAEVAEIRERYIPRKVTTRHLATEYGVARSLIHRIVTGQSRQI